MWLQALQSNFQQAPSSFDCQEPKPSPWNIITIITVISLYQGCWPSNRSVEPHTYLAISAHIEHNPGKFPSFPVPFAFLPCIRILQTMVFHYFRHCSKRTRWHASSHFARHCTRGSSLLWGRRCPLPLMWSWDHPHWLIFQGRSTGNHDISTWNKNPLNTKSVVGSSGSSTAAVCFRMCMGHNRLKSDNMSWVNSNNIPVKFTLVMFENSVPKRFDGLSQSSPFNGWVWIVPYIQATLVFSTISQ